MQHQYCGQGQTRDNCGLLIDKRAIQVECVTVTMAIAVPMLWDCYTSTTGCRLKCTHLVQSCFVCACLGRTALLSHDGQTAKPANNDAVINIKHTVFSQLI